MAIPPRRLSWENTDFPGQVPVVTAMVSFNERHLDVLMAAEAQENRKKEVQTRSEWPSPLNSYCFIKISVMDGGIPYSEGYAGGWEPL